MPETLQAPRLVREIATSSMDTLFRYTPRPLFQTLHVLLQMSKRRVARSDCPLVFSRVATKQ